jgi:hypothetical protein
MRDAETALKSLERSARDRFGWSNVAAAARLRGDAEIPAIPPPVECGELSVEYSQTARGRNYPPRNFFSYRIYGKCTLRRATALAYLEEFLNEQCEEQAETAGVSA